MELLLIFTTICCCLLGSVWSSTVTKLESCSTPDTTSCHVLDYYLEYQQVKCLTAEQIKIIGKGLFVCEEPHKNCWYPSCQMRLTELAFERTVRPQCKCTEESRNLCGNKIDSGKKSCIKLDHYNSEQWVTCRRSQEVLAGCPFPQTHCWFPCQSEKHHLESGNVAEECECNSSDASSLFVKSNVMVLTVLISLLVTFLGI